MLSALVHPHSSFFIDSHHGNGTAVLILLFFTLTTLSKLSCVFFILIHLIFFVPEHGISLYMYNILHLYFSCVSYIDLTPPSPPSPHPLHEEGVTAASDSCIQDFNSMSDGAQRGYCVPQRDGEGDIPATSFER